MVQRGEKGSGPSRRLYGAFLAALLIGLATLPALGSGPKADAAPEDSASVGVLPCKKKLALTAVYRVNGRIRFEGVADPSLAGKEVKVYEIKGDELVATTRIRRDGTWWANSETSDHRYTWLTKFVAEAGGAQTRWRRLGQAIAIRGRKPVVTSNRSRRQGLESSRTRIQVKISGGYQDDLTVGIQTGCSRYEVDEKFRLKTNREGVATISVPRPEAGSPFLIYRASTVDGFKISPPIVVKPGI